MRKVVGGEKKTRGKFARSFHRKPSDNYKPFVCAPKPLMKATFSHHKQPQVLFGINYSNELGEA